MTRNLDRRIEIMFPVLRSTNCRRLKQILISALNDRSKGRFLKPDGTYQWKKSAGRENCSQEKIYNIFAAEARDENDAVLKVFSDGTVPPLTPY